MQCADGLPRRGVGPHPSHLQIPVVGQQAQKFTTAIAGCPRTPTETMSRLYTHTRIDVERGEMRYVGAARVTTPAQLSGRRLSAVPDARCEQSGRAASGAVRQDGSMRPWTRCAPWPMPRHRQGRIIPGYCARVGPARNPGSPPACLSVPQMGHDTCARFRPRRGPGRRSHGDRGRRRSHARGGFFAEAEYRTTVLANSLLDRGAQPGTTVGILGRNSRAYAETIVAVSRTGADLAHSTRGPTRSRSRQRAPPTTSRC